jgi:hypothetical protein
VWSEDGHQHFEEALCRYLQSSIRKIKAECYSESLVFTYEIITFHTHNRIRQRKSSDFTRQPLLKVTTTDSFQNSELNSKFVHSLNEFYVHVSVHCGSLTITVQKDATMYSLIYLCKLLYMFRVVPPITRSTFNCNYSIWHCSNRLCYLPLWFRSWT